MNKKNTVAVLLISIIVLSTIIIGASFAFFVTSIDSVDETATNVQTNDKSMIFMSTAEGAIDLDVSFSQMGSGNANDEATNISASSNATFMLMSSSPNIIYKCKFDIIYERAENSNIYERTRNANKELTITGSGQVYNSIIPDISIDPNQKYEISTPYLEETNFDELEWKTKIVESKAGSQTITKNVDYAILVKDIIISSNNTEIATVADYTFTVKYYNLTKDQNDLLNKQFSGIIKVDSDSVLCE